MKKYIPEKMIKQSRFRTYYETWDEPSKQRLLAKLQQLIEENAEYTDSNNYGHLCNLLTSLALVMVLKENGKTTEEAQKEVAEAMYTFLEPQIASMERLASHSWFVGLLRLTMPVKFWKTLGYGWNVEFLKCPKDTFAMITHKCIYQQIFTKYGMPEMTAIFCNVDDILYSNLPRAEFRYTEQIGRGGSMCDYSFKKR